MGNLKRTRANFPKMNGRGDRRRVMRDLIESGKAWRRARDRYAALIYTIVLEDLLHPTDDSAASVRLVQQTVDGRTLDYLPEFGQKLGEMV